MLYRYCCRLNRKLKVRWSLFFLTSCSGVGGAHFGYIFLFVNSEKTAARSASIFAQLLMHPFRTLPKNSSPRSSQVRTPGPRFTKGPTRERLAFRQKQKALEKIRLFACCEGRINLKNCRTLRFRQQCLDLRQNSKLWREKSGHFLVIFKGASRCLRGRNAIAGSRIFYPRSQNTFHRPLISLIFFHGRKYVDVHHC